MHWGALWGREGAASRGGVRGNLYKWDRFGRVVSERRRHRCNRVEVVQPDGRQRHRWAEGHGELRVGGEARAPHLGAVWVGKEGGEEG